MGVAMRIETDAMGPIEVPSDRYWGASTARALVHFPMGRERFPPELIAALGLIKEAAAHTNSELGVLASPLATLIARASGEVARGAFDNHFPVPVWQTGSGTQLHMNANEVIANRAIEIAGGVLGSKTPIHPNDHVNLSQSSNDVVPTAIHVAAVGRLVDHLLPAARRLCATLAEKSSRFENVIKMGRTHLQDALPLTLGQAIGGWVSALDHAITAVEAAEPSLYELAIGGTAVGTGFGSPRGFGERTAETIAARTGRPFVSAPNKFQALASAEAIVSVHGALKTLACSLVKIANDVRWLASGPRAGLGEFTIPENEPGSSMMPGKVNPTQCEALILVCTQVHGNDVVIGISAQSGHFELNVARPLLAHALLQTIRLLGDAMDAFDRHCAKGLEPNLPRLAENVERSLMLVTALRDRLGYDRAAAVAHKAHAEGLSLREAALGLGGLSGQDLDALLDPATMLGPSGSSPSR